MERILTQTQCAVLNNVITNNESNLLKRTEYTVWINGTEQSSENSESLLQWKWLTNHCRCHTIIIIIITSNFRRHESELKTEAATAAAVVTDKSNGTKSIRPTNIHKTKIETKKIKSKDDCDYRALMIAIVSTSYVVCMVFISVSRGSILVSLVYSYI